MATKLTDEDRKQLLRTKNALAMSGISIAAHKAACRCLICEEDALANAKTVAGVKEFFISGFCELCFDVLFADEEEC